MFGVDPVLMVGCFRAFLKRFVDHVARNGFFLVLGVDEGVEWGCWTHVVFSHVSHSSEQSSVWTEKRVVGFGVADGLPFHSILLVTES